MSRFPVSSREISWGVVILWTLIHAFALRHELTITTVDLNDNVYHYTLAARMAQALESGENPLDCWASEWSLGYPVPRTYQPLGHIVAALAYLAVGKSISLLTLFVWVRYLLLSLFPLTLYCSCRLLRLDRYGAVAAALAAPLLATNGLFGLEYGSFVWRGKGLYTQAWAIHLLPLTLGWSFRAVQSGRGLVGAGVLLALTFLAHMIYGYMGAVSICLLVVLPHPRISRLHRLVRIGFIGLVSMSLTAFFLLPLLSERGLINQSRWEESWKWDSFGLSAVSHWLLTGELFDFGRWPILSFFALAGLGLSVHRLSRSADDTHPARTLPQFAASFVLAGMGLWLALYGGRPSWGVLMSLLGAGPELHLHRLIGGVHLFGLFLVGIGLGSMWRWGLTQRSWFTRGAVVLGSLVLLIPVGSERLQYLSLNTSWGKDNLVAYRTEANELHAALASAQRRPGRVYPGLAAGWGGQFRIGQVPLHAFVSMSRLPAVAFLYHSMALTADIMVRFDENNPAHYRLFNIGTVLADTNTPLPDFLRPLEQHGRFRLFAPPDSSYFELVSAPYAIQTDKHHFYESIDPWLASDWVAKRQHLWLDFTDSVPADFPRLRPGQELPPLASIPDLEDLDDLGTVEHEQRTGERYYAQVRVEQESFLLFKMTYHPNWRISVDGTPRRTVMLSPGFMGVGLSPGLHQIVAVYQPEGWKMPLLWAGVCLTLLAAVAQQRGTYARAEEQLVTLAAGFRDWSGASALAASWRTAGGLVLLVFPICLPLLTSQLPDGHDSLTHFPRLIEFHENIRHGIFPPRWAPDLSDGYGQPLFVFSPPGLYFLGEIWRLLSWDVISALNLASVVIVVMAGVNMFLLGRLYGGQVGGWLATAAYVYGPYFQVDLYVRHAWTELCGLACYPLILYGFGRFATDGSQRAVLVGGLGYALLLGSDYSAALVFTPVVLAFIAWTAWQARSWPVLAYQSGGLLLGLGLSAWVWLPAVAELPSVLPQQRLVSDYFHYSQHFVYLHQLISPVWGYGLSVAGYQDKLSFSVGWSQLGVLVSGWIWAHHTAVLPPRHWWRFFCGVTLAACGLMLPGSVWLWDHIRLLADVQFPWRLLGPASVSIAVLIGLIGPGLSQRRTLWLGALGLLILANIGQARPQQYRPLDLAEWTPQQLAERGIAVTSQRAFEPRWLQQRQSFRMEALRVIHGAAEVTNVDRTPTYWSAQVTAEHETRLEAACAYFPGWRVVVDGQAVPITIAEPTGLIQFQVPAGRHTVSLAFTRTWARWLGEGFSLLAALSIIGLCWRWRSAVREV